MGPGDEAKQVFSVLQLSISVMMVACYHCRQAAKGLQPHKPKEKSSE